MTYYCTLPYARQYLGATVTTDDALLFAYIRAASSRIEEYCGQNFDERWESHAFNGEVGSTEPRLQLDGYPLLEATTLTNGNGDVIASENFTPLPKFLYPKQTVRLNAGYYWRSPSDPSGATACSSSSQSWVGYADNAIEVVGKWGYVPHWSTAWKDTGLTLSGSHSASVTTLTLSAVAGTAILPGHILKISNGTTYEQLLVTAPLTGMATSTTITVERGFNGTTALTFSTGAVIRYFHVYDLIQLAAAQMTAALYQERNNPTGRSLTIRDGFDLVVPIDMPEKVKALLQYPLRNWWRGGF